MNINKLPRRIDRKAGGRNKKIIIKNYPKKSYEKLRRDLLVSANRLMEESNYHPSAA